MTMEETKSTTTTRTREAAKAPQARKDDDRIKIIVHTRNEHDGPYVDVGLKGRAYRIRRGHPVDVPRGVYEILKNAVEGRVRKVFRDGEEVTEYVDVPRHTVEVVAG